MYAITGASGNTGRVVAHTLLDSGKQVRVIGRTAERLRQFSDRGAQAVVADLSDTGKLIEAFTGAEAVYAMIPPDLTLPDVYAYDERITKSLASALFATHVPYVVSLSSVGADKPSGTGFVVGLNRLEEALDRIEGLNTLHLRAGYFMENLLPQAEIIHGSGGAAGPLRGDLKLPMIATRDIGRAAATALMSLGFKGHQTRELLGPRDLTYNEATAIIGKAIGKATLKYTQMPDEQLRPVLTQMGMSSNVVDLLLEMSAALNSGYMKALEARTAQNTTPTPFEEFVAEEFVPAYKKSSRAA